FLLARYEADRSSLERCFAVPYSPRWRERLRAFLAGWREALSALPFDELSRGDRVDWLLFRRLLAREEQRQRRDGARFVEMEVRVPCAADLIAVEEARRRLEDVDAAGVAERLDQALAQVRQVKRGFEAGREASETRDPISPAVAFRAGEAVDRLRP